MSITRSSRGEVCWSIPPFFTVKAHNYFGAPGQTKKEVGYYVAAIGEIIWIDGGPVWHRMYHARELNHNMMFIFLLDGKIPVDSVAAVLVQKHVSFELYVAMCTFTMIGIAQVLIFLVFNITFRRRRYTHSIFELHEHIISICIHLLQVDQNVFPENQQPYLVRLRSVLLFYPTG